MRLMATSTQPRRTRQCGTSMGSTCFCYSWLDAALSPRHPLHHLEPCAGTRGLSAPSVRATAQPCVSPLCSCQLRAVLSSITGCGDGWTGLIFPSAPVAGVGSEKSSSCLEALSFLRGADVGWTANPLLLAVGTTVGISIAQGLGELVQPTACVGREHGLQRATLVSFTPAAPQLP